MSQGLCLVCRKPVGPNPRAKYCSDKHKWLHWSERAKARAAAVEQLPPPVLPPDADAILPAGPERLVIATHLALVGHAPAGARGYRVGMRHGPRQLLRWFPIARLRDVPMFSLEPFEWPVVPVVGNYAVVYLNVRCEPIGGPRFTLPIEKIDPRWPLSMGDRTFKPRPRLLPP